MDQTTLQAYNEYAESFAGKASTSDFWITSYNWMTSSMPPGARVIEVGTGAGRDARLFLEGGFRYTGVEPSAGLAKIARDRTGTLIYETDLRSGEELALTTRFGKFDGLWCVATVMHLTREETPGGLKNLRSLVVDDAPCVIAVKDKGSRPDGWEITPDVPAPRWYTWWSHEDFTGELDAAGFTVDQLHHRPGWHVFHCHADILE